MSLEIKNDQILIGFKDYQRLGKRLNTLDDIILWVCPKYKAHDSVLSIEGYDVIRKAHRPYFDSKERAELLSFSDHENSQFIALCPRQTVSFIGLDVEPRTREIADALKKNILASPRAEKYYSIFNEVCEKLGIKYELLLWCWQEAAFKAHLNPNRALNQSVNSIEKKSENIFFLSEDNVKNYFLLQEGWFITIVIVQNS